MPNKTNTKLLLFALLTLSVLSSCAQSTNAQDPFENVNRKTFAFNDSVDRTLLRPAAKVYQKVIPRIGRTGVNNLFANARYPLVIINQFLQGKGTTGVQDTARFLLNSTIGLAGVLDVASGLGLAAHQEDFGQTLGAWGVESGPYIVIPLFGPSSIRDGLGKGADYYADLTSYIEHIPTRNSLTVTSYIAQRESLLAAEQVVSGDRYLFIRDAFLQQREFLVNDGASTQDAFLDN